MLLVDPIVEWWRAMKASVLALTQCRRKDMDERTYCSPSVLRNVLTAAEAKEIINAAGKADNYGSRRHVDYPTVDVPVAYLESVSALVEKASLAATVAAHKRCEAPKDLALVDGFVVKYEVHGQTSLGPHKDAGRFSATFALSRPEKIGVHFPPEASKKDVFYAQKFCPATCFGDSCDTWRRRGTTQENLDKWHCDCSLCGAFDVDNRTGFKTFEEDSPTAYDFQGGGTRFPDLRNVTFFPNVGQALIHGAHQLHAGEAITSGQRFLLALFFDLPLCRQFETEYLQVFILSVIIFLLILFLLYVALFQDFEQQQTNFLPTKKKPKNKHE